MYVSLGDKVKLNLFSPHSSTSSVTDILLPNLFPTQKTESCYYNLIFIKL